METLSPESETDSYARGFYDKCAALGIDPEAVLQGHTLQSIVPEVLGAATLAPIVKAAAEHGFDLDAYMLKTGQAQVAPTGAQQLNRQAQLANLRRRASASPGYNPNATSPNAAPGQGLPWNPYNYGQSAKDMITKDLPRDAKAVGTALYDSPLGLGAKTAVGTYNMAKEVGRGVLGMPSAAEQVAAKPAAPAAAKPVVAAPVAAAPVPAALPAVKPPVAAAPVPAAQPAAKPQPKEGKMFGVPESQWNKMKRPEQQQAEAAVAKERGKPYVYNMQPGVNGGPAVPNYKAAAAQGFYDACIKAGLPKADVEALVMSKYSQATAAPTGAGNQLPAASQPFQMPGNLSLAGRPPAASPVAAVAPKPAPAAPVQQVPTAPPPVKPAASTAAAPTPINKGNAAPAPINKGNAAPAPAAPATAAAKPPTASAPAAKPPPAADPSIAAPAAQPGRMRLEDMKARGIQGAVGAGGLQTYNPGFNNKPPAAVETSQSFQQAATNPAAKPTSQNIRQAGNAPGGAIPSYALGTRSTQLGPTNPRPIVNAQRA